MTPEEFCEYVINGTIFNEVGDGDSDYTEQGRYIWPDRYNRLVELARVALSHDRNLIELKTGES